MTAARRARDGDPAPADAVVLGLPVEGRWMARNSPADRVPSHGTDLFATTHAIDLVAVDGRRTATTVDWRTVLATEPPERFVAWDRPILAPVGGTVTTVHDGEPDHVARRSPVSQVPYALTQGARAREGGGSLAGNHVVVRTGDATWVLLAHLREGSIRVAEGDPVTVGQPLGACGNSGNSTQPHLHLQAMDAPDPEVARGLPIVFRDVRVWPRRGKRAVAHPHALPANGEVVAPVG